MPIQFPSNPSTGQTYTYNSITWNYDGVSWAKSTTGSAATVTVGNSAPVSATTGALWVDNEYGDLNAYFGNAWVNVSAGTSTSNIGGITGSSKDITWANVQTANFTANVNTGYPINTTSSNITVTLPANPVRGDLVTFIDYAGTFAINPFTMNPGSNKINGLSQSISLSTRYLSNNLVYVDDTQGWQSYSYSTSSMPGVATIEYLVVAGGGGGRPGVDGAYTGGGGGAGGYLSGTNLTVSSSLNITVGAGGTNGASNTNGSDSSLIGTGISIVAIGGGKGGTNTAGTAGVGGSGGGAGGGGSGVTGAAGTPGQGFAGGNGGGANPWNAGGGGGASATGNPGSPLGNGNGGAGLNSSITGTSLAYAGGGGGGCQNSVTGGTGGSGVGGNGGLNTGAGTSATANRGGGGGGGGGNNGASGNGGSGVVIIAYPDTVAAITSIGVGLTYTVSSSRSGYRVYTFTAGTGTIQW